MAERELRVISLDRRGGKTAAALELCASEFLYMVVLDHVERGRVCALARERGLNIPFPLTFHEFLTQRFVDRGIRGFVIDNADMLLQHIARSVPVAAITLNAEPAPKPKEDLEAWQRTIMYSLNYAKAAVERGDWAALGTINEHVQPLVDAFMARGAREFAPADPLAGRGLRLGAPGAPTSARLNHRRSPDLALDVVVY